MFKSSGSLSDQKLSNRNRIEDELFKTLRYRYRGAMNEGKKNQDFVNLIANSK